MHKKIYAALAAISLIFGGLQAMAANDTIQSITYPTAEQVEGNVIKSLDGKIPVTVDFTDQTKVGRRIVYLVLKPGYTEEEFMAQENLEAVIAIGQGKTDETKQLSLEICLGDAPNGNYTLLVGYDLDAPGNYEPSVFRYANPM